MKTPEESKESMQYGIDESYVIYDDESYCPGEVEVGFISVEDLEAALAYIQQLEAKVPRWISFDEEKPPVCERIWCFGEYNGEPFAYVDIAFENGNTLYAAIYKPTHWMPLPEPPVEE